MTVAGAIVVVTSSEDKKRSVAGVELPISNVDLVICCSFVALSSGSPVVIGTGFEPPVPITDIVVSLKSMAGAFVSADVVVIDS